MKNTKYYKVITNGLQVAYQDCYTSAPTNLVVGAVVRNDHEGPIIEHHVSDGMPYTIEVEKILVSGFKYSPHSGGFSCWTTSKIADEHLEEISKEEYDKRLKILMKNYK